MRGFKSRPHTYSFDLAPTGRARCRACRSIIERGALRLVTHAFVRPNRATRFVRHVRCIGAEVAADVMRAHGTAADVPREGVVTAETVTAAWGDGLGACG